MGGTRGVGGTFVPRCDDGWGWGDGSTGALAASIPVTYAQDFTLLCSIGTSVIIIHYGICFYLIKFHIL